MGQVRASYSLCGPLLLYIAGVGRLRFYMNTFHYIPTSVDYLASRNTIGLQCANS